MKAVPLRTMAMSSMKGQSGNCSSGGNSITSNPILRKEPTNSVEEQRQVYSSSIASCFMSLSTSAHAAWAPRTVSPWC